MLDGQNAIAITQERYRVICTRIAVLRNGHVFHILKVESTRFADSFDLGMWAKFCGLNQKEGKVLI